MESPVDATWQPPQQQQAAYFHAHPPPGSLSNTGNNALPYPLTRSAGSAPGAFDPIPSTSPYSLAHRRHNSLAASTSSTDSGFSDLSQGDTTFRPRSSTVSDQTADSSFPDDSPTLVSPLRHSRGNIGEARSSMDGSHPSGLVAPPTLLDQELHQDGRPRRPMNAFMIYARHRRPEFQKTEPGLKTGDLSKRLSAEWKALSPVKKSFYLEQAKVLKDHFHERFPNYVYRRRPNNQGRRSRARSARGSSGSGRGSSTDSSDSLGSGNSPGSTSPGFVSPITGEFPSASQYMGAGPSGFRLSSSLSSSQSSSSGSRAYDPSAIHQMAPRMPHLADFDQATAWPGSPSQLYSSNGGNAPRSSMYAPYPAYGQSPNWDPAFARNWDGTGNALNRTWSAGYSSAPENYMAAYDQRSQAMPYPSVSYAVSNQLTRSTEQLPISEAEYGRFNRVPMYMPSRTDLPLPSPGLSSSGMGRDPSATGHNWPLPPTPSLPPPMLRQEQDGQGTNRAPPGSSTDTGAGASSTRYPPATNFTPPPMLPQDGERALDDPMTLRSSNASGDHETQV